ncbi:MAG TPA: flagellin [Bacteriovoracaceae bacterium]|nr:flagellin [Bacteriovoracaceae bacterium]
MGFRINTNISSVKAQTSLSKVSRETQESSAKLSSGERITKAADDAAGLAISEKLKANVRSSKQANRNANDGISLVQVAEGGLNETSSILTRMKELAVQAASDTVGDSEREKASLEYEGMKSELERISAGTEFNGRKLLNGSGNTLDFHVGTGADSSDDHVSYSPQQINSGVNSLGVDRVSVLSKLGAQNSLNTLDSAISKVAGQRATLGSLQNRLVASSNNLMIYTENTSAANSRIRDLDYATETANQARNTILQDANTTVLAQANMSGQNVLKLIE